MMAAPGIAAGRTWLEEPESSSMQIIEREALEEETQSYCYLVGATDCRG